MRGEIRERTNRETRQTGGLREWTLKRGDSEDRKRQGTCGRKRRLDRVRRREDRKEMGRGEEQNDRELEKGSEAGQQRA